MSISPFFSNRQAILATMHRKQDAIAPLFQQELGVTVTTPSDLNVEFDTDAFGTFTRDVDRAGNQLEAARRKATSILDATGADLAIASEGSFSPHPAMPLLMCDRELVVLIDRKHQLEVVGEVLSTETNHAHKTIHSLEDAVAFAAQVGFPDHGLVVMATANPKPGDRLFKGITDETALKEAVNDILTHSPSGTAHLETDMRAMHNPTRMHVIAQATQDLIRKLKSACPSCHYPGFAAVKHLPGLPCELCQFPTLLIRSAIYQCQHCQHRQEQLFPNGLQVAPPEHCSYCNP
jgi:hypothetical protein